MSRYTGPQWRISRRLGFSTLENGKELNRRAYAPGQHGQKRKKQTEKVRLCNPDWPAQCGEVHVDESPDRAEDRHHVEEAADHQKQDPDGIYFGGRPDRLYGYAGHP